MTIRQSDSTPSDRQQAHEKLLKEALKRPGIPEMMRVYENWRHADRGLDAYRAATRKSRYITTKDHANSD